MAATASTDLRHFAGICRKIICVGRNYREHAKELGNAVPEKPLVFLKAPSSILQEGKGPIKVPPGCSELHHEVELAVVIGKEGHCIQEANAMNHVGGYALALDMTARNFQNEEKKKGIPWTLAKCWDTFCPISNMISIDSVSDPHDLNLWLTVDGVVKQDAQTKDMIFRLPHLISYISSIMSLDIGDVILTGTPSGVSPVYSGQTIEAGLSDLVKIKFEVQA